MSSITQCPECKYSMAVKDERSNTIFCASCGLFKDPFYTWKKTDMHSLAIPSKTSIWIPLVISTRLKDSPVRTWLLPQHQATDSDPKWGGVLYGYLSRTACDVDRGWILQKKIYDAAIKDETDDLISLSAEVKLVNDLQVLVDINDVKVGLPRAKAKFQGVITRKNFLDKHAAAIHVFDPSDIPIGKYSLNDPVSPKKAANDHSFMDSLKKAW